MNWPFRLASIYCAKHAVVAWAVMVFAIPPLTGAATIRMAVMGDSISAGSGVTGGSPNWVAQLTSTFPGAFAFQNEASGRCDDQ